MLGVRNEFQKGLSWRQTAAANMEFCQNRLHYWSAMEYRRVVGSIFGNCEFPYVFFLERAPGGAAAIARKLPGRRLAAWLLGHIRMYLVLAVKA
jgi:hypothetical protein